MSNELLSEFKLTLKHIRISEQKIKILLDDSDKMEFHIIIDGHLLNFLRLKWLLLLKSS